MLTPISFSREVGEPRFRLGLSRVFSTNLGSCPVSLAFAVLHLPRREGWGLQVGTLRHKDRLFFPALTLSGFQQSKQIEFFLSLYSQLCGPRMGAKGLASGETDSAEKWEEGYGGLSLTERKGCW